MDISVIICAYNGAARLPKVLDLLFSQKTSSAVDWEIIVVDNNSRDQTTQVLQAYQALSPSVNRLRVAFEPRQGLAFARRCAVRAAKGDLLAFLDDDNLPNEHWLQAVYDFGQQHPEAGAYGSQIVGRYEVHPPENFERIACFLAVIDRGDRPFRYDLLSRWLFPAGAGMVIRRQAWLAYVPEHPALCGVSANGLSGKGEDIETLSYIRKAGLSIWHNPEMKIEHVIGRDRLTETYLIQLFRGIGLSRYHTRSVRFQPWQKPWVALAYGARDLLCLTTYYLKHFREKPSTVRRCELTLILYSFLSPFYCFIHSRFIQSRFVRSQKAQSQEQISDHRSPAYFNIAQFDSS
jgi:glycosyltransferase involved in cell wall biosynthesis